VSGSKTGAWQRAEAARVVDAVIFGGRSLDAALATAEERLKPDDKPLLRLLCYGVLRNYWRLRSQLHDLLDRPLKKGDRVIEALLLVGLYQLADTRVPDHAAVSMTVEAVRLLRKPKLAGLVNAILRNFVRRQLAVAEPGDEESRYNHPRWLIDALRSDWPEHWQAILEANNDRAPMWLRVSPVVGDAASYLGESGLEGNLLAGLPQAVRLSAPRPVDDLPGFAEGLVSVQDAAAQIAAAWLLADDGDRVLDACAAPGGKTGHLLELMGKGADVTAIDADESRLRVLTENLARLGLDATVIAADASNRKEWWDGRPFDRILLDAPCSATGVIRRHPDIKILRREGDIEALAALQRRLLAELWETLAPGGRLLYVTCSVLAAENDAVVADFLAARADARENRALHDYNIRDLMCERAVGYQVLPGNAGMDGFYYACLEKAATQ
jgi:16S rRNA (cytosine967-C5)-methyltransferase